MTECSQVSFPFHPELLVVAKADAPRTSSDGGLLLLRQADERLGVTRWLAESLPDERDPSRVEHDRLEQVRQRVYQIAMGYEDCNDANDLRDDPMLKTVCDRTPESEGGLSSQPTLSRFENAATGKALRALRERFEQSYVDALPSDTDHVVLDIDTTDDETHGHQQLTFFHGFYDQHMYHPLLVFDADRGELVTVLLRPGNAHAARAATIVLSGMIRRIKRRFPGAKIVVRGDAGFSVPRVFEALEALNRELGGIDYIIGIAKNPRLLALAESAITAAAERFEQARMPVRHFSAVSYAAKTWSRERHVIVKAEHGAKGANPRFVATTLADFDPGTIYDVGYCARGRCENQIKDLKNALKADRLSCSRFAANCFRLLLHAAAYRLMTAVRAAAAAVSSEIGRAQFDTVRLRLLKVAAHVSQSARRVLVRLPKVFPLRDLFIAIAQQFATAPG